MSFTAGTRSAWPLCPSCLLPASLSYRRASGVLSPVSMRLPSPPLLQKRLTGSFLHGCRALSGSWAHRTSIEGPQGLKVDKETARCSSALTEAPTSRGADLPKTFDYATAEDRIYTWWESNGYFLPDENAPGKRFCMSMPPPNVTGRLHMGHAVFVTLQDIMVRYARMQGCKTLWVPGTDHAGIATQMVVEKMLAAEGKSRLELGRAGFESRVWEWKAQYGSAICGQLRKLGASCDWTRERFTLDTQLSEAVVEAFSRLHAEGLIYRGSYLVNWSPKLRTAVSDLEVEYSEEAGTLYYFKYPVAESEEFLPVATTRPETILGDTAVAVHPEDERYRHLVGRECVVPTTDRRIPIIADTYVDREFGTGALKITPGHDPNDYEIGKRCGLEMINIMDDDARLNGNAGRYAELDRADARKALWKDMQQMGLAIRDEPYQMRVPRSQRSGEVVEPLVREQWFVRMGPLAEPALKAVEDGAITIVPDRFRKVYSFWLENIKDWCISRQLWWGHRIPVWYAHADIAAADAAPAGRSERWVVAGSEGDALLKAREQFGSEGAVVRQEEDVLDTWFSSGLWPFSTLGWPAEDAPEMQRWYPTQVLETGHDILFFWVARMIMMGLRLTGQAPFSTVYLHGLVRDGQGRKMSKSLGNVIDPVDTVAQYGTDALRFTLATGTTPGQDLSLSMDKVVANRNFLNKLWNAGKFLLFNLQSVDEAEWAKLAEADFSAPGSTEGLPVAERWIIGALHQVVDASTAGHERMDFSEAGRLLYEFAWDTYADWYIEASKARLYGEDAAAAATTRQVLVYVFDRILRLAHPFMPFVTEELWQVLPHTGDALITARYPAAGGPIDEAAAGSFSALQEAVRAIRNARAEYGVEPGRKIGATLLATDDQLREDLSSEADVIALLARLDATQLRVEAASQAESSKAANGAEGAAGQITLVVREGLEVQIPLAGLFDPAKELERLQKQQAKLEKDLAGLAGRLQNPKFMANARPDVVAEARAAEAEASEKLVLILQKQQQMRDLL